MSEAATQATTTTAAAAPTTAEVPRTATGSVDVQAFAKQAAVALEAERAAADAANDAEAPAAEPAKDAPAKDPKTGKFVKASGGAEPTAETKATEPKPPEDEAIPEDRDVSLAAWRRKASQDPVKTVELLFGKKIEELQIPSKSFAAIREEKRRLAAREQKVDLAVRNTVDRYSKFDRAEQAWKAGDAELAMKEAFGATVADVGKRHIAKVSGQAPADPRVDALIEQNKQLAARLAAREQQEQQATAQQTEAQQRGRLQEILSGSEEPGIAKVAAKRVFQDAVIGHLRANFDPTTRTSIPPLEAARLAYDEIYGDDGVSSPAETSARTAVPAASKAVRTPSKGRNLDTTRAAEPAPPVRPAPGSPELLRYYARLAAKEEAERKVVTG